MTFDPNEKHKPKNPPWATYISSRSPKFKVHTQKGHATNAINCLYRRASEAFIYQWVDDEWVLYDSYEVPTTCADCGGKLGTFGYKVGYTKPAYRTPQVCEECYKTKYMWGHRTVVEKIDIIPNRIDNINKLYEKVGAENLE